MGADVVVGPEARGFVLGAPVAYGLGTGFVLVRKPGKLPGETVSYEYALEYGTDTLEIHKDAIQPGQKAVIVDDLLATGRNCSGGHQAGGKAGRGSRGILFAMELRFLNGRETLKGYKFILLSNMTNKETKTSIIEIHAGQLHGFPIYRKEKCQRKEMMMLEALLKKITEAFGEEAAAKVMEANEFAEKAHANQKRSSGEPYSIHPLAVANILADLGMDVNTIISGLLHDTIEDTGVTREELEEKFGSEVAEMVDGVTKLSRLSYKTKEEQQVENLRKMFLAMAKDIRVIIIKLSDRLHNLRTLEYIDEEKQREKAYETLEIYAPLAHRLGIFKIKWELEDIALRYIDPRGLL
jgi:adenine phosphoribosyltransferase